MTLLVQPMESVAPLSASRAVRRQLTGEPFPGCDSTPNHAASTEPRPAVVTRPTNET